MRKAATDRPGAGRSGEPAESSAAAEPVAEMFEEYTTGPEPARNLVLRSSCTLSLPSADPKVDHSEERIRAVPATASSRVTRRKILCGGGDPPGRPKQSYRAGGALRAGSTPGHQGYPTSLDRRIRRRPQARPSSAAPAIAWISGAGPSVEARLSSTTAPT